MLDEGTKRTIILEYLREQGLKKAGAEDIRAIQVEIRRRLSPGILTSPSFIAQVLREASVRVNSDSRFVDPAMEEPYASRLEGLLRFRDLDSAEACIQKLDAAYREYRAESDRVGTALVRELGLKGKLRAASMAGNARVREEKRREKGEIAHWFKVWLEVPDLFPDWLEMRKQSEEFQRLFAPKNGSSKQD